MSQVKAVIGHVSVEIAQRKRTCSRHKSGKDAHSIAKGDLCLVVKNPDGAKNNYCCEAAEKILALAENDLAALRSRLSVTIPE